MIARRYGGMNNKLEEHIILEYRFQIVTCVEDGRVYTYLYARFVTFLSSGRDKYTGMRYDVCRRRS